MNVFTDMHARTQTNGEGGAASLLLKYWME